MSTSCPSLLLHPIADGILLTARGDYDVYARDDHVDMYARSTTASALSTATWST